MGCGNSERWYYGEWKVDEEKTFKIAGENQDLLGTSVALMKNALIKIDMDNVTVSDGDQNQVLSYELVEENDGSVILKTGMKDLHLAQDENGVYMIYEKTVTVNDEVVQSEFGKIYLKRP